ncbi:MAG: VWA domain-containing protein [Clostridia bacterium]|nr:VWA domain-containing protein [Clostridia bacterium]
MPLKAEYGKEQTEVCAGNEGTNCPGNCDHGCGSDCESASEACEHGHCGCGHHTGNTCDHHHGDCGHRHGSCDQHHGDCGHHHGSCDHRGGDHGGCGHHNHVHLKPTPVGKLSGFVYFLRNQGLAVGIRETEDALKALRMVGFEDRETVRDALRAIFAGSRREQEVFDRCFNLYFVSREQFEQNQAALAEAERELEARRRELEERLSVNGRPIDMREDLKDVYARMPQSERDHLKDVVDRFSEKMQHAPKLYEGFIRSVFMKSLLEQQMILEDAAEGAQQADSDADLLFRDISSFKETDIPKAHQLIDQVTRRINGEISARRKSAGRSAALDFRRTLRAGLSTGGALCKLRYKRRHSRKKHVVMLCDVSGSMLQFSEFAIRFLKSLSEVSDHSDIFLFSEQVQKVNPFALQNMDRFSGYVRSSGVWGRGTNIGAALDVLLAASPAVLTPGTVLLILSDGKSVDVDRAEAGLIRAARAAGSVVWMNPIPESKWQYLKGATRLRQHCSMVPCGTLDELARACAKLIG